MIYSRKFGGLLLFAFLVFIFLGGIRSALAGFEDRRFEEARLRLIDDIYSDLISSGECANKSDCQKKKVLFASPSAGGISIQLWGVKNKMATQLVFNRCAALFLSQLNIAILSVEVYSVTKQASLMMPFWQSAGSSAKIIFRRE